MNEKEKPRPVVYAPEFLVGLKNICSKFKVSRETVFRWIDEGAPIVNVKRNKNFYYCTEVMRMQAWLESKSHK